VPRRSTERALTESETARRLRVSIAWLRNSRRKNPRNGGPPFIKFGRAVRYLVVDLDAWLASRRVVPQLPPGHIEQCGDDHHEDGHTRVA